MELCGVWRVHGYLNPHVTKFTKAMVALPAILVISDEAFYTAGNLMSSQLAFLLSENDNMLMFIKHNLE